jgi:hypothetical protein
MPPVKMVLDALQHAVLPAAGGAALVAALFLLLGRRLGATASAAAVFVGFVAANFKLNNLDPNDALTWANSWRLLPWTSGPDAPGWQWLPRAALLLVVVGLLSRWIGLVAAHYLPERRWWGANLLVWAPRIAAVVIAGDWLTRGKAAENLPELWPITSAAMFLIWVALDGVARGGAGAEVAAYQAAALYAAGVVLLYAHSASSMESAVVLGSAMFGVAVASRLAGSDASGAVPAAAAFLPALLLAGRPTLPDNNVPTACFWLVAVAPLVLLPFLIPALARSERWYVRCIRAVLVFAPLITAVVLASQHEQLVFEEE